MEHEISTTEIDQILLDIDAQVQSLKERARQLRRLRDRRTLFEKLSEGELQLLGVQGIPSEERVPILGTTQE